MHFRCKSSLTLAFASTVLLLAMIGGCSFFPEVRHRPSLHNPFPQMKQVAILPFFNQSNEPTVDGEAVALAYYSELQSIPGFEVLPIGVASNLWTQFSKVHGEPRSGQEFQQLAQFMGVEAVVVGSVTDFSSYYPPRLAMTAHWYAANPGFHPVPPGYGLPWGTKAEKRIPRRIVEEAEFELAREQLATQAPVPPTLLSVDGGVTQADAELPAPVVVGTQDPSATEHGAIIGSGMESMVEMPAKWPDPTGLIPDAPSPAPPALLLQTKPVLSHTRLYRGDDVYVTDRLSDYVGNDVDTRVGGWQSYLNRSNDFIRFCCHLHITEMLESRGGSDQSDLILRWPISRY